MEAKDPIVERFERAVDLPMYLAYRGYDLVPNERDPSRITMANPKTGDALSLRQDLETGGWSYAGLRDRDDRGTLADYLATRHGLDRKACLERVIALGNPLARDPLGHDFQRFVRAGVPELQSAIAKHRAAVESEISAARHLDKLGVAKGTLDEWRFGRVRNSEDLTKLVSDPSDLWASKYRPTDQKVVITEQPIDAMAYEKSRGKQVACYMATGGEPTDLQKKRLAHLLCEVPPGVKIVLAFGRDESGRKLAAEIQALVPTVKMERDIPAFGARWSDQMKIEHRHSRSMTGYAASLGR
jgi:hypothetical protein